MASTMVMPGLRPATSGVQFTARPALRPESQIGHTNKVISPQGLHQLSAKRSNSDCSNDTGSVPDASLSVIEVEAKLRDKVRIKYQDMQQGFQNYDVAQTLSVTKGEFRRVLDMYAFPLTTDQFEMIMNKVDLNPNGTVKYCDFLDKFHGRGHRAEKWKSGTQRYIQPTSPQELNIDMIEKMIRDKIQNNMRNVVKAFRLYDYNRDGHIQRHELRKVLENYCFKMTDSQYDKLYHRYDFQHKGMLNYSEFLQNLGLNVENRNKPAPDGLKGSLQWREDGTQSQKIGPIMRKPEDAKLANLTIEELEIEFRKKMRENYANLKRMFLVFDKHLDGFVLIEDLKSALDQFVLPMSDAMFAQLMSRLHIKASGKVSWELFLKKFQDPQSHGNGQTIPIKANHKFFPVRGGDEKRDIKDIIRLLHDHVVSGYSSFKKAFLEIDKTRKGRITRKELRKILNTFKFRISSEQFRDLMFLLDPQNTNSISYHKFLDLFEEKESKEAHKWLVSCHKFNETKKPSILAWETIEDLLKDKIVFEWKIVSKEVVRCDPSCTGKILPSELRRLLAKITVPLADDHFNHLVSRIKDKSEDGKVSYIEFFTRLGVTIKPGDLEGLSTQITKGSEEAEQLRNSDLVNRQQQADIFVVNRSELMSAQEIITRLSDRFSQHSPQLQKSFHQYGTKGKVTRKNFRQMLESMGFYIDDDQFKDLCAHLSFHKTHMTYADFVTNFEDPRIGGPASDIIRVNNHHVNDVRGDESTMTAEMAEQRLINKLRENFGNLRAAFYKFDDDHNGLVTKQNFRSMMDSFMCNLNDKEFERFCRILGIENKTKISYREFLDAFEIRDTAEGHKWLNSNHRYNELAKMKLMTAEQVHQDLASKAHRQYQDLAKAFRTMDSSGNGVITRTELRNTLYKFMMPMNKEEFNKLWKKYDVHGSGVISHQDFLGYLTGDKFAPGDDKGISGHITDNNEISVEQHLLQQQYKQQQITVNQANRAESFKVEQVIQQLKDKIRDKYSDFQTAFKAFDKRHRGYLTVANIQQVLVEFNYYLDDDQFYDLLERLCLSKPRSRLTYEAFLRVFEEGHTSTYARPSDDAAYPQIMYDSLTNEKAETKLRNKISKDLDNVYSALQALDPKSTGKIHVEVFRRILDNFCFKLSAEQFKHVLASVNILDGDMVDYLSFIESFRERDLNMEDNWLDDVQRNLPGANPAYMTPDEVETHLRETVKAHFRPIARAMTDIDYARIGVITKEDFRQVIEKYAMRLSDEQFEHLLMKLKVNEFQNIDYQHFMKKYSTDNAPRPGTSAGLPGTARRPLTNSEFGRGLHSSWSAGSTSRNARPFTPLVNAEDTETKLKDKINRHWKDIQRFCRLADTDNTGQVSQREFKFIIGSYTLKLDLSDDDIRKLLLKYDLKNNGMFCYKDFLRNFVLHMGPGDDSQTLLTRRKVNQPKLSPPPHSPDEASASKRLLKCVATRWKDMLRNFREFDPGSVGVVDSEDFRQVLRNFNVNLTEDEFSNLTGRHGNQGDCLLSYNDFIKEFLKNT